MPDIPVKIMMNVGTPDQAFAFAALPHRGIGLARLEFIINRQIGIHPKALLDLERDPDSLDDDLRSEIEDITAAYAGPREFFVQRVAEGVSMLAAAFAPYPVIVRMSDFKSNEYANLLAGPAYEPHEENPMIGYRGASRYLSEEFADCFAMECEALRYVRDDMGLTNVWVMIPFVRTLEEASGVIDLLGEHGLVARRERPQGRDDVRGPVQRGDPRAVPRALRRLLDRLQRPDPAHPRHRPRLLAGRGRLRRAQPGRARAARAGDQGVQGRRQVRRHLRPGPLRPPRPRRVAAGAGHRVDDASTRTRSSTPGCGWRARRRTWLAARAPPTTPTWPSGCSSRASSR